jgi:hypothetical protein
MSTQILIGLILEFVGTIMLGYTVLAVHFRIGEDRKLDNAVFKAIKTERYAGVLGLILIAIGFVAQVTFYVFS